MGDFLQLPPIPPPTLAAAVIKDVPAKYNTVGSSYVNGLRLFNSLRLFTFDGQERAKGDPSWTAFIEKLRSDRTFLPSSLQHLKVLSASDVAKNPDWQFAPVVVGGNEERAHINSVGLKNYAVRKGVCIVAWRTPITDEEYTSRLTQSELDAFYEDPRLVTLFAAGAPAYLNENIHPNTNRKGISFTHFPTVVTSPPTPK